MDESHLGGSNRANSEPGTQKHSASIGPFPLSSYTEQAPRSREQESKQIKEVTLFTVLIPDSGSNKDFLDTPGLCP